MGGSLDRTRSRVVPIAPPPTLFPLLIHSGASPSALRCGGNPLLTCSPSSSSQLLFVHTTRKISALGGERETRKCTEVYSTSSWIPHRMGEKKRILAIHQAESEKRKRIGNVNRRVAVEEHLLHFEKQYEKCDQFFKVLKRPSCSVGSLPRLHYDRTIIGWLLFF